MDNLKLDEYNEIRKKLPIIDPNVAKYFYETMYVCDLVLTKFEIDYSVSYGTLLGALRHGGLIPWDGDLDVMVFNPEQKKMFEKDIIQEFNKYGFNFYKECNDIYDPKCEGKFVNHIYNELRFGSEKYLTTEVLSIKKFQKTKYNDGRCLFGGSVAILDFFPHSICDKKLQKWRPVRTAYQAGDRDVITTDEIWPLKRIKFGNFEVSIINEAERCVKRWAGEECFESPRKTHMYGPVRTSTGVLVSQEEQDKYISSNSDVFKNLEVPCLIDPLKFQ